MVDAPHGPLIFGLEDEGGGGGGPCIGAQPLAWGAGRIAAGTANRYLQPPGEYTGTNIADINPLPHVIQATATIKRFQIRVRLGAGNGNDVVYELMKLDGGGVPLPLPNPMVVTLASTFSGIAEVLADNVCADGDQLVVEVRKDSAIATSPNDVQGFVQFEQDCGGGGGGGGSCCAPQFLSNPMWFTFGFGVQAGTFATLDLDASTCGQDPPLVGVIRASPLFPGGTPPVVDSMLVGLNIVRVLIDATSATTGNYVLELTNNCGCCTTHPIIVFEE